MIKWSDFGASENLKIFVCGAEGGGFTHSLKYSLLSGISF